MYCLVPYIMLGNTIYYTMAVLLFESEFSTCEQISWYPATKDKQHSMFSYLC